MRHPYFAAPRPTVFGHRGASGELPENTLAAFGRALVQGADVLETDVHLSRDGVVVVCHDADVSRTTEGTGRVGELGLEELRSLDAGYRFSRDGGATTPFRGLGLRIPTLEELFEAFPEARFNIEIKAQERRLVRGVLGLVREGKRADRTLLAAAEDETMALLRAELGAAGEAPAVGASTGDVLAFVRAAVAGEAPPPGPMALQVPPDFGGQPLVTERFVAHAHAYDVAVHVWTINDEDEMRRLLELGVDGVMSDFPGRLRAVVDRFLAA